MFSTIQANMPPPGPASATGRAGCARGVPVTRQVVVPVFPRFQILDVTGPAAVFEAAGRFAAPAGYAVTLVSLDGGQVTSSGGLTVDTRPVTDAPRPDILLVPGGVGTRHPPPDGRLVSYLQHSAAASRRVASVCTGAFLLARAGLLDGRRATTHWRHAASLARRYPAVTVLADRIWINDGRYWTSAGVSAGIDLALALVTEELGGDVARQCAREVVVYYQRPGGQSQFSTLEALAEPGGRFAPLLAWIRGNVHLPHRVEDLAARAAMSPRNFSRRFRREVGHTPAEAVRQMRLEVARTLVETTDAPIARVARQTGFGNLENMRRVFLKSLGQSPRALRSALRPAQRP